MGNVAEATNAVGMTRGEGRYLAMVSFAGLLANIVLNFLFIKQWGWGINGAAVASSLSYLLVALLVFYKVAGVSRSLEADLPTGDARGNR